MPTDATGPRVPTRADSREVGEAEQLEAVRAERDEYIDALRRLQAEFENYRKRMLRQQTEHLSRAAEALVAKLLPALDAVDSAGSHFDPDSETGKAVRGIAGALYDVLAKEGLERLVPEGEPFDPETAEAVAHETAEDADAKPVVAEVLRAGFAWKGRIIRPAMVKVRG